ncbi:MAG: 3-dehydroquinate dehydratase [Candidatus Ancillula trichonymphae]|jgi:3-dehydroquinate dehydratase-2|nr:3-dehydroquinate dehydratase [Candidatus Ancillula trichonymphae]
MHHHGCKLLYLLHGPNLNMLGKREPGIYGSRSLDDVVLAVERAILKRPQLEEQGTRADQCSVKLVHRQTNSEAELISWFQEIFQDVQNTAGVIINPGAFTHYSYGLRDAMAMLSSSSAPVVEVHISNPHARENFRHNSVVSPVVTGTIAGLGVVGYELAAEYIRKLQDV